MKFDFNRYVKYIMAMISSIEEFDRIISAQYPNLCEGDKFVPKQGKASFVIIIGDNVFCMPHENIWEEERVWHEALLLKDFEECNFSVSIPKLVEFDPEKKLIVMSKVAGETLSNEILHDLEEHQLHSIGQQIGTFLSELHTYRPLGASPLLTTHSDDIDKYLELLSKRKNWVDHSSSVWEALFHSARIKLTKSEQDRAVEFATNPKAIPDAFVTVHGDLHPGNVMYDSETGKVGIIDLAGATGGYRVEDFLKIGHWPPEVQNAWLTSYNEKSLRPMSPQLIIDSYNAENAFRASSDRGTRPPPRLTL